MERGSLRVLVGHSVPFCTGLARCALSSSGLERRSTDTIGALYFARNVWLPLQELSRSTSPNSKNLASSIDVKRYAPLQRATPIDVDSNENITIVCRSNVQNLHIC